MSVYALIVMDGFGVNPQREGNAIAIAGTPNIDRLKRDYAFTQIGASGLDDRQLSLLESYGIVVPVDGHDDPLYGAEALVCARQSAVFLELGMEPRHLRAFKVAADREAGLYEQLVLPLLRQRNPAARAEATRTVGRLSAAGVTGVAPSGLCTFGGAERFYSYRRDGRCGRMASLVWVAG